MNHLLTLLFVSISLLSFSQIEEVGPLTGNPELQGKNPLLETKLNVGTFDSTFIYNSDTITLPVFDDFSADHFQTYNAGYTDLGVTSILEYRLLDLSSTELPNDVLYTQQQTFRRTFDVANGTFVDDFFPETQIQMGDMTEYPTSYTTVDVYPPYYIYDTIDFVNDPDTVWILDAEVFQDSARQFFAPVVDPDKYWLDNHVYHNYTMAKNPLTLGVATFDGLDEKGYPYAFGTATSGVADYLTSKPINMSLVSPSDSVYFSYVYQAQGLCDSPEAGDSLILEFYEQGIDQWNEIWRGGVQNIDSFYYVHHRVDSIIYFTDAFQFRFKNFGALSGSLDHFHLDYVELEAIRGYQDTVIKDFAFVYPINTLLDTYTSVPWDHYKNNFSSRMADAAQVVVRNSNNIAANNNLGGFVDVSYGGALEGSFNLVGADLSAPDLDYGPNVTYYSFHNFDAGYHFPETKPGIEEEWDVVGVVDAQYTNFSGNDTTYNKQIFKNYYSYDDGTAELAYGPTGPQARLAIKYDAYELDSLVGAMIHFVPSVNDVSNKLFLLTVWDDNGGEPGDVLYEDEIFFPRQPKYQYDENVFSYYFLKDTMKLALPNTTFYVGWRQFDSERLNVGLDMNIDNGDKTFYSVDGGNSWLQSGFEGSVMIRPIFSTAMDVTLGIKETESLSNVDVNIYPNPTTSIVNIEVEDEYFNGLEVYDMQGKMLSSSMTKQVNLVDFQNGMYLIRLVGLPGVYKVYKN